MGCVDLLRDELPQLRIVFFHTAVYDHSRGKSERLPVKFERIFISGWRQFADVDILFHPRMTILTGANGAGKSTILKILARHFGWDINLLATPQLRSDGSLSYYTGWIELLHSQPAVPAERHIGILRYTNGGETFLVLPSKSGITYDLQMSSMQAVEGVHIASHRPQIGYQRVSNIPTNIIDARQAYQNYHQETVQRYRNQHTNFSPTYRMKEAIISMATFGPGNQYVQPNPKVAKLFYDFKGILAKVLPPNIGFQDINVRIPDVVLVTDSGEFVIDAASGGLMSIIDLAWQLFLYSHDKEGEFVVVFDEPENHLHPSMQRSLLGRLLSAFPLAQFIVATHSPFIVSSVRDSNVYVLQYRSDDEPSTSVASVAPANVYADSKLRVYSILLDRANKAGTASEILRDVLGVPVTLPEWASDRLSQITAGLSVANLTAEGIAELRRRLEAEGLEEYYPEALARMPR